VTIDPRLLAFSGKVAASHLRGQVDAAQFSDGEIRSVTAPVADLRDKPQGLRVRQLLLGAQVRVFDHQMGHGFVQAADGYVGWVEERALGAVIETTHRVATFATHAYSAEDIKSRDAICLPFGAALRVLDERRAFYETDAGFVPKKHLRPLDRPFEDPATVAQLHFQVPYLWGGNSTRGIDCSGLVTAALKACGSDCPADSDMQQAALGTTLACDGPLQRGDLLFWRGHVGMMVDADVMIHANAHHMAVAYEPVTHAITRIAAQGDGPVLARKRPD
jgi:hypothetical protein